jgi:hypothetical protein
MTSFLPFISLLIATHTNKTISLIRSLFTS